MKEDTPVLFLGAVFSVRNGFLEPRLESTESCSLHSSLVMVILCLYCLFAFS